MQKYKLALILYSGAVGVFYGATTASAAPFRSWVHDLVAQSTSAVTQFVASNRDFDFKSDVEILNTAPVIDSGMPDPIAVFVSGIQRDYPTAYALEPTDKEPGSDFSASTFNAYPQRFASSVPVHGETPLEARNDAPVRFVFQDVNAPTGVTKPANRDNPPHNTDQAEGESVGNAIDDLIADAKEPNREDPQAISNPGIESPFDTAKLPSSTTGPSFAAVQTIPESATLALLGLGVAGLSFIRRRPARAKM